MVEKMFKLFNMKKAPKENKGEFDVSSLRQQQNFEEMAKNVLLTQSMVSEIYDAVVDNRKVCPVCGEHVKVFLPFGAKLRGGAKCPYCGALERHRALMMLINKNYADGLNKEMTVLHFAPENCFRSYFERSEADYWPVDFDPNFKGIRKQVDITKIDFDDCSMDLIICMHVLEHVEDDITAMKEMYRVLKSGGRALVAVPYKDNVKTLEKKEYNTPELRMKYYGGTDHVRYYGFDIKDRLERAGFSVTKTNTNKEFTKEEIQNNALVCEDTFFICTKADAFI